MRRFSAAYLADTRRGLWTDREALAPLDLPNRRRILDVGCGTGSLATVLREESDAGVVCLDADRTLLEEVGVGQRVTGDAGRLPFADGGFDLVACQALLVNLPDPIGTVREFGRVSSDLVAVVEPDNARVEVESTVEQEADLAARARKAYLAGIETDAALGTDVASILERTDLVEVTTTRHDLRREVEPPYDARDVEGARRKARGRRLVDHEEELRRGGLSADEFEALVDDWRAMGRAVADQLVDGTYRRRELVPFHVSVGRVPETGGD